MSRPHSFFICHRLLIEAALLPLRHVPNTSASFSMFVLVSYFCSTTMLSHLAAPLTDKGVWGHCVVGAAGVAVKTPSCRCIPRDGCRYWGTTSVRWPWTEKSSLVWFTKVGVLIFLSLFLQLASFNGFWWKDSSICCWYTIFREYTLCFFCMLYLFSRQLHNKRHEISLLHHSIIIFLLVFWCRHFSFFFRYYTLYFSFVIFLFVTV